jgi:hypothetical protein
VAKQSFEIRVIDEFILLGNSAIMRCLVPSFVSDFVQVSSWLIIDGEESSEIRGGHENFGKVNKPAHFHQISSFPSLTHAFCWVNHEN